MTNTYLSTHCAQYKYVSVDALCTMTNKYLTGTVHDDKYVADRYCVHNDKYVSANALYTMTYVSVSVLRTLTNTYLSKYCAQ